MIVKTTRFLLFVVLFQCWISCTPKGKEESSSIDSVSIKSEAKEAKFSPKILDGNWINEKYLEDLLRYKSPRKSQSIGSTTALGFENGKVQINYSFHEGLQGTLVNQQNKLFIDKDTGVPSENSEVEVMELGRKIKYEDEYFIKKDIKDYYKIVEALLFEGKYMMEGKEVELFEGGKLEGWEEFDSYIAHADYHDAGMQVDQITLGKAGKEPVSFGFKFHTDSLTIYDLKCIEMDTVNNVCGIVENGAVKYRLKQL